MVWRTCSIHAGLAFASYALFVSAGIGGFVYFYVKRFSQLKSLEDFHHLVQDVRFKINRFYLIAGLFLLTVSFVLGFFQSKTVWGSSFNLDFKMAFSLFLWSYYFIGLAVASYLGRIKPEKASDWIALVSLFGLPLIGLNLIFGNLIFKGLHHFL